jgi:hypothetical protein
VLTGREEHRVERESLKFSATSGSRPTPSSESEQHRGELGRRILGSLATVAMLLAHAPAASAADECQSAFEAWAKLSEHHVRPSQNSNNIGERGACIPNETVRKRLLDGIAITRARCEQAPSWFNQSPNQTKKVVGINESLIANESFIVSLTVCPPEATGAASGWTTKSAPAVSKPAAEARPCLQISHKKQEHYTLINRHCTGRTVLAVIETPGNAGKTECKAYTIDRTLALRAHTGKPPYVNQECVLNQDRCSKELLGQKFPECDWSSVAIRP